MSPDTNQQLEYHRQLIRDLLDLVDRETCTHEETYRGGAIWTICSNCDRRWADDRGGFVPYEDPPEVVAARAVAYNNPAPVPHPIPHSRGTHMVTAVRDTTITLVLSEAEACDLYIHLNPKFLPNNADKIKSAIAGALGYVPDDGPDI